MKKILTIGLAEDRIQESKVILEEFKKVFGKEYHIIIYENTNNKLVDLNLLEIDTELSKRVADIIVSEVRKVNQNAKN